MEKALLFSGRGIIIIGSPEEGYSKLNGVNPKFKRNTTNDTQNLKEWSKL